MLSWFVSWRLRASCPSARDRATCRAAGDAWRKIKNPEAPTARREAEEEWGKWR
jgi:hypothetical protein